MSDLDLVQLLLAGCRVGPRCGPAVSHVSGLWMETKDVGDVRDFDVGEVLWRREEFQLGLLRG